MKGGNPTFQVEFRDKKGKDRDKKGRGDPKFFQNSRVVYLRKNS